MVAIASLCAGIDRVVAGTAWGPEAPAPDTARCRPVPLVRIAAGYADGCEKLCPLPGHGDLAVASIVPLPLPEGKSPADARGAAPHGGLGRRWARGRRMGPPRPQDGSETLPTIRKMLGKIGPPGPGPAPNSHFLHTIFTFVP